MADLLSSNQWTLLNIALWVIWKNRNDSWSKGSCSRPASSALLATHFFQQSVILNANRSAFLAPHPTKWSPPPTGFLKVNTDVALFRYSGCWGLGAVIRDSSGSSICYQSKFEHGLMDISLAEASALLMGVLLARSMGLTHVLFESDALMWDIIGKIKSLISSFVSCKFIFVPRANNQLAHSIANLKSNGQGRLLASLVIVAENDLV
ncbi:uncharacterized protein [Rutidosis leptorrhynchoides]|uniref:uncharacterized protein n=1 Tax=Rutidosis leptorrhynchoides TaxID=125765 RepID=UPI003A9A23C1